QRVDRHAPEREAAPVELRQQRAVARGELATVPLVDHRARPERAAAPGLVRVVAAPVAMPVAEPVRERQRPPRPLPPESNPRPEPRRERRRGHEWENRPMRGATRTP